MSQYQRVCPPPSSFRGSCHDDKDFPGFADSFRQRSNCPICQHSLNRLHQPDGSLPSPFVFASRQGRLQLPEDAFSGADARLSRQVRASLRQNAGDRNFRWGRHVALLANDTGLSRNRSDRKFDITSRTDGITLPEQSESPSRRPSKSTGHFLAGCITAPTYRVESCGKPHPFRSKPTGLACDSSGSRNTLSAGG